MKNRFMILAVCAIAFFVTVQFATAIDKIEGALVLDDHRESRWWRRCRRNRC